MARPLFVLFLCRIANKVANITAYSTVIRSLCGIEPRSRIDSILTAGAQVLVKINVCAGNDFSQ